MSARAAPAAEVRRARREVLLLLTVLVFIKRPSTPTIADARVETAWSRLGEIIAAVKRPGEEHSDLAKALGVLDLLARKEGIPIAIVGGAFGVLWTIMAIAITGGAPDVGPFSVAKVIFPLFGILFTGAAIVFGVYCNVRAKKYQEAYEAYRQRRQQGWWQ